MVDSAVVTVPARLRPDARQVPGLIWTMARADTSWGGPLAAAIAAGPVYAPIVISAHARRCLVSLDRHALMIINLGKHSALGRTRSALTSMLALAMAWVLSFGVVFTAVHALSVLGADINGSVLVGRRTVMLPRLDVLYVIPVLGAVVCLTRLPMLRGAVVAGAQTYVVRKDLRLARADLLSVEGFFAWPKQHGHGSALVAAVRPFLQVALDATGGTLVVGARTPALAQQYERWGMGRAASHSRVLLTECR